MSCIGFHRTPVLQNPCAPEPLCSRTPVLQNPCAPEPLCSRTPVLQNPCAPETLCSRNPVLQKPCAPETQCSRNPVLQKPCAPETQCSRNPVLQKPSAPETLCSRNPVLWQGAVFAGKHDWRRLNPLPEVHCVANTLLAVIPICFGRNHASGDFRSRGFVYFRGTWFLFVPPLRSTLGRPVT